MAVRPVVIDLFCGVGGMSLGFEAAGFDIGAGIDIDPIHCAAHEFNFPYGASICRDISDISAKLIEDSLGQKGFNEVDVIIGGPPCQGFSQIGKRQLDDPRNRLVFEYVRLVRDLRPKYFVFENVKGITLGKQQSFVTELIDEFQRAGYQVTQPYQVLNAADYGIAQNRHRFILMGSRLDQQPVDYPVASHGEAAFNNMMLLPHVGSRDVLSDLEMFAPFFDQDEGIPRHELNDQQGKTAFDLCYRRQSMDDRIYGHVGSIHTTESQRRFAEAVCGSTEPKSRFFKLDPSYPSNTLRAGTDSGRGAYTAPRPIHYLQPRCITVREGARLHSFPDWFRFHATIWHGFRQIGNAVAPLFAKHIAAQLIKAMNIAPAVPHFEETILQDANLIQLTMTEAAKYYSVDSNVIGKRVRREGVV